ncbi:hypothetical protein [Marinitoga aeolica]|uniref:Uncharacterized protein n=1 Tax=Marinitoga aeolica TaxID=2809031 RepID=A0ABY8PRA8_9BACT|nr:hypothetical protein [Marinitoga aeolica]WGS65170.1 hypothetical protein JRV97_01030 [Marinitoga aeolica]
MIAIILIIWIINFITYILLGLGFFDLISNYYMGSNPIFFIKEKTVILVSELILLLVFYSLNILKKNKLKIIPYEKILNNYTLKGFIFSNITIAFFHSSSLIFLYFFNIYLQMHPVFFDNYILKIVNFIYSFRFFFYSSLKFIYYTSEILFFYFIFRDNIKPILIRIFLKTFKPNTFKENRNFYLEYFIHKLPKMKKEKLKSEINKMIDELEDNIELSILYSISMNYSLEVDLNDEIEKIKNKIQNKELKNILKLFEEINEESFTHLKELSTDIDSEYNEQKREILLSAILYNIQKYSNEYSQIYFLLDLLFEYQYYIELPKIEYSTYPYNFIYIFKDKINNVLEDLEKNKELKESYPEITLLNRTTSNLFNKYIERGMI